MRLIPEGREATDLAYNVRLTIPAAAELLGALTAESARVLLQTPPITAAYGPSAAEYLDIYAPSNGERWPVHIFIHGGYWRAFSAKDYAFVAPPLQQSGVLAVLLNYGLCPEVSLDEIVAQARRALIWIWRNIARFGGEPTRITIAGHSAGGHLAAMLAATAWTDYGLPPGLLKGVAGISGLFDLAPLEASWLAEDLNLTADVVARNSPVLLPRPVATPTLVAVGELETAAFHQQAANYLATIGGGEPFVAQGRHHIDILHDLRDAGPLSASILRMIFPHRRRQTVAVPGGGE